MEARLRNSHLALVPPPKKSGDTPVQEEAGRPGPDGPLSGPSPDPFTEMVDGIITQLDACIFSLRRWNGQL